MPLSNASTDFVTNVIVEKIANVPFIASESHRRAHQSCWPAEYPVCGGRVMAGTQLNN